MACSVTVTNGTLDQKEIDAYIARATKKYGVEPRHIDINVCGDPATYKVYNGYAGEGTLTVLKIDSDILIQMAEAFRTGVMPEITVITAQTQKGTNKVERVAYSDVTVDEFMLAKFEKKAKTELEVPFKFGNFEVLETL